MVACGADTSDARDSVRTGIAITLAGYLMVLLLGATYWSWLATYDGLRIVVRRC